MKRRNLWLLAIPLTVLFVYGSAIDAPFVYDDRIHILENGAVTGFRGVTDSPSIDRIFRGELGLQGRPVLFLTYGVNYLYSGSHPSAFRWLNLLIHTANSLLVFLLIQELGDASQVKEKRLFQVALTGALLFAAHPLLTESVTYIAGRSSSLCALFYLAALVLTLGSRRQKGSLFVLTMIAAGVCGVLAWLVKQDAVTLPPAIIGLILLLWPKGRNRRWLVVGSVWASLLVAALLFQSRGIAQVGTVSSGNAGLVVAGFEQTLPARPYILTSIKELSAYYYWRLFVPMNLNVDPEPAVVNGLGSIGLWVSIAILSTVCGLGWRFRKSDPLITAGILLVVVSPLSAYAAFPLADVVSEHRAYISTLGAVIITAALLWRVMHPMVFAAGLLGFYVWLTVDRNAIWKDEVLLWRDAAQQTPEKLRPHLNLGALYQARGDNRGAIGEYEFVLKRAPGHDAALANLGSAYLAENQMERAETLLDQAVAKGTRFPGVYVNLSVVRIRQHRWADASALLKKALTLNARQPMAHHNLGDILYSEDRKKEAIEEYLAELQINPDLSITHLHLAMAYEGTGAREEALQHYLRVVPLTAEVQEAVRKLQNAK